MFRSGIAVAEAVAGSSDSTPSPGTSICRGCSPKEQKNLKKNKKGKVSICDKIDIF